MNRRTTTCTQITAAATTTNRSHTSQCRAPINVPLGPSFPPRARSSRSAVGRRNRVRQEARWHFRMSGSRGAAGKRNHVRQEARWHFRASGSRGTVSGEIASDTKHVGISGRERAKAPWANEIACDRKHVSILWPWLEIMKITRKKSTTKTSVPEWSKGQHLRCCALLCIQQ